jgi:hypothetical protein
VAFTRPADDESIHSRLRFILQSLHGVGGLGGEGPAPSASASVFFLGDPAAPIYAALPFAARAMVEFYVPPDRLLTAPARQLLAKIKVGEWRGGV